ncbi:MAG: RtcB family protein [Clostridiales bacterium]|nr:RtcB family protein [Clostridiales bacterium]
MIQVDSKIPHKIYAETVENTALKQFKSCLDMDGCVQGALMADCHTGYVAPIGSVLKFKGKISPALVGYDIGCGVISAELNIKAEELDLEKLKASILRSVPIGFNRHKDPQIYVVEDSTISSMALEHMMSTGLNQLGTLGGGNHFIELGTSDKTGNLHIIIHSGSRGFGHKVATHYMQEAAIQSIDQSTYENEFDSIPKNIEWKKHLMTAKASPENDKMQDIYDKAKNSFASKKAKLKSSFEDNYSLDINSDIGKSYINDQNIALDYALANRETMVNAIILDIQNQLNKPISILQLINRNHNHAEIEPFDYVIHRKGATHAEKGMFGVIPGNMKDGCFIVEGLGNPDSMCSSSHGAGRVLSRKKAKEQLSLDKFHTEMQGIITNHGDDTLDEAPDAYKNIFEVMNAQKDLVKTITHITPVLNIKG